MYVEIGNDQAIEGYRDATSADPEQVLYRDHPGQWVTRLDYPDGIDIKSAFESTVEAMRHHMKAGERPKWVEGDSKALVDLLCEQWSITDNTRPADWGQDN